MVVSSNLIIQWGVTGSIPGPTYLRVNLPVSYINNMYVVVGTMVQNSANDARLFVIEKRPTTFAIDWTNGSYTDPVNWLACGY